MVHRLLADAVLVVHLAFIGFVVVGGLIALRRPRLAWIHLPVAAWGALIELTGWVCPLTPLEQRLRIRAGQAGYEGGFVEHYVLPVVYPGGLTRELQFVIAALVVAINLAIYSLVWRRHRGG